MSKYIIGGGRRLSGSIAVPGAKNSVLPILAASILTAEPVLIHNSPGLSDAENMLKILESLGCRVGRNGSDLSIDASNPKNFVMPEALAKVIRSSIFMLGPIVARLGRAVFYYPGGCEIGLRPIDLHLKGLRSLNVDITEEHGKIICKADRLIGSAVHLDYPSVGATENIMMAAVLAEGRTEIQNAAREPEVLDLQKFLNNLGGRVSGAGTDTVIIDGVTSLGKGEHTIMPDRIVAGTLMAAAAITEGDITLEGAVADHMHSTIAKIRETGCLVDIGEDYIRVRGPERPKELVLLETLPYPGFPTDMQAQMFAVASVAQGTSIIVENVFDNRFKHAAELAKMGANATIKGRMAIIRGVPRLYGSEVRARDLRGGAALTLAALRAERNSVVEGAEIIERGYERLDLMLESLGADIRKID
ncbi:MAG: UDP-N-acetylglucosamine 1-carboxyvinyltransferase [Christensenellales bacterium]|jgi:UDP-N-acetylglucosamine 1-carboxyvinyltransferase